MATPDNWTYRRTISSYYTADYPGYYSPVWTQRSDGDIVIRSLVPTFGSNLRYRDLILKGINAGTDYYREYFEDIKPPHLSYSSNQVDGYKQKGYYSGVNFFALPSFASLTVDALTSDIALKRIKQKLSDHSNEFKSFVPLAELGETRSLIKTTARATEELLVALISLKRNPKRALAAAQDAWLQFSFGISPTIADTNALINTIGATLSAKSEEYLVLTGAAKRQWMEPIMKKQAYTGDVQSSIIVDCSANHIVSTKYTCGFRFPIDAGNNYGVSDRFGLTFGDLPSTGWELVPFSWVLDYFGTMGDFLADVFVKPSGLTTYVCRNTRLESTYRYYCHAKPNSSSVSLSGRVDAHGSLRRVAFRREMLAALPHRSLRFKTADEIGVNQVKRLFNLASLLKFK